MIIWSIFWLFHDILFFNSTFNFKAVYHPRKIRYKAFGGVNPYHALHSRKPQQSLLQQTAFMPFASHAPWLGVSAQIWWSIERTVHLSFSRTKVDNHSYFCYFYFSAPSNFGFYPLFLSILKNSWDHSEFCGFQVNSLEIHDKSITWTANSLIDFSTLVENEIKQIFWVALLMFLVDKGIVCKLHTILYLVSFKNTSSACLTEKENDLAPTVFPS